jgi:hypothetical protein
MSNHRLEYVMEYAGDVHAHCICGWDGHLFKSAMAAKLEHQQHRQESDDE